MIPRDARYAVAVSDDGFNHQQDSESRSANCRELEKPGLVLFHKVILSLKTAAYTGRAGFYAAVVPNNLFFATSAMTVAAGCLILRSAEIA